MIHHSSWSVQEWLPGQAVHVACLPVPRHDGSDDLFRLTDIPGGWLGDLDSFFTDSRVGIFMVMVLLRVMHALGRPLLRLRPGTPRSAVVDGPPQVNLQRIFFVCELLS